MNGDQQWILVRHGDTEWTEKNKLHGGRLDRPLSSKGRKQAELTGNALIDADIRAIYSSPQGRALQTAEIIADMVGVDQVQPIDGFRELNFGLLEGGPILTYGPDGTAPKILKPFATLLRNLTGESERHFIKRVAEGISQIQDNHVEGRILIVSHWGALSAMMALLFGGDAGQWLESVKWSPCGITIIRKTQSHWEVLQQDHTDHLEGIGI